MKCTLSLPKIHFLWKLFQNFSEVGKDKNKKEPVDSCGCGIQTVHKLIQSLVCSVPRLCVMARSWNIIHDHEFFDALLLLSWKIMDGP